MPELLTISKRRIREILKEEVTAANLKVALKRIVADHLGRHGEKFSDAIHELETTPGSKENLAQFKITLNNPLNRDGTPNQRLYQTLDTYLRDVSMEELPWLADLDPAIGWLDMPGAKHTRASVTPEKRIVISGQFIDADPEGGPAAPAPGPLIPEELHDVIYYAKGSLGVEQQKNLQAVQQDRKLSNKKEAITATEFYVRSEVEELKEKPDTTTDDDPQDTMFLRFEESPSEWAERVAQGVAKVWIKGMQDEGWIFHRDDIAEMTGVAAEKVEEFVEKVKTEKAKNPEDPQLTAVIDMEQFQDVVGETLAGFKKGSGRDTLFGFPVDDTAVSPPVISTPRDLSESLDPLRRLVRQIINESRLSKDA